MTDAPIYGIATAAQRAESSFVLLDGEVFPVTWQIRREG
jgi:hypothetical protein